ncbi:hypothetical protein V500_06373 [Pseudogymnoascus sp. VKM F-4518 (FW-2643)]|nr:hypothetical protein V500_06373 [Pseudogymnoascus sp. VKM F-4518 (FW-2643)]
MLLSTISAAPADPLCAAFLKSAHAVSQTTLRSTTPHPMPNTNWRQLVMDLNGFATSRCHYSAVVEMLGPGPLVVPHKTPGESDGRGIQLYIISIITIVLAGITVGARISTRLIRGAAFQLWWDDYSILFGLILSIILAITEIEAVVNGYGEHAEDLGPDQAAVALKWFYLAQIFYKLVVTFNKLSLLLFYLRIFPSKTFRLLTWIGLAVVGATGITFIAGTIWQCHPLPYFWDRRIKGGQCIRSAPWWQSYSAIQIATDVFILVLPIPSLASLSLKFRHKLALIGVFALGGFVCIATIIRLTTLASSAGGDATYNPIPATNWSVIEANVGLICACLPSLKPFLDNIVRTCLGQPARSVTPNPYSRSKSSATRSYALGSICPNQAPAHRWDWGERGKKEATDSQVSIMKRGHTESLWGIQKQIDVIIRRSEGDVMGHERSYSSFQ